MHSCKIRATMLAEISIDDLDAKDRLSYRIFKYERETERESYHQPDHFFPINSLFGYHTYFAESPANTAFFAASDYDDFLVSLADFTRYNRDYIEILREVTDFPISPFGKSVNFSFDFFIASLYNAATPTHPGFPASFGTIPMPWA